MTLAVRAVAFVVALGPAVGCREPAPDPGPAEAAADEGLPSGPGEAEAQSLSLDLKVLVLTFNAVVFRTGSNAAGDATMPEFTSQDRDK